MLITLAVKNLIDNKRKGKKILRRPIQDIKTLIIQTYSEIKGAFPLTDLLRVTLPYMATYFELTNPEMFSTDKTISWESDNDVKMYFKPGGYTCWTGKYTVAKLMGISISDMSNQEATYISSKKYNSGVIKRLIKSVESKENVIILFDTLEISGTSEGHDFVYLKSEGIGYWMPIGPSEKVLNRLQLHPMTSIVEVNKPIRSIFSQLKQLIYNTDPYEGVTLIDNLFPGLNISLSSSEFESSYSITVFDTLPLKLSNFTNFWTQITNNIPEARDDLLNEALIIKRDVDFIISLL